MEQWVEINLDAKIPMQNRILLEVLRPYVDQLRKKGEVVTFHYFREPEIRFRVRLRSRGAREREKLRLSAIARSLIQRKMVREWHFGNHGEKGVEYKGEEDRYGRNGWKAAQKYFMDGSETALELLDLKRRSRLESPLWAKGLGNPWEGGGHNPWREREEDPLVYHWSRFVHLFSNQLGFDMQKEAELSAKQSERYLRLSKDFGMKW